MPTRLEKLFGISPPGLSSIDAIHEGIIKLYPDEEFLYKTISTGVFPQYEVTVKKQGFETLHYMIDISDEWDNKLADWIENIARHRKLEILEKED